MPDDLKTIVQRMIDAGESEDNIATVIQHFKARSLPTRPVSAEDFAPEGSGESLIPKGVSGWNMLGDAIKSTVMAPVNALKTAYSDQRPEDVALGPGRVLAPLIRQAGAASIAQARKAVNAPTASEAIGHGAAALLPVAGPAAAQAGEDIGSGDPARVERGGGDALAMIAAPAVTRAVPPIARGAGRAAPIVGRGLRMIAKESVPTVGAGLGASVGGPAGAMIGGIAGRSAARIIGRMGRKTPVAEAPHIADTPPVAEPSPNAGGRIVPSESMPIEDAMAAMLQDVQQELAVRPPPARLTTPPEPNLPAGFTPRSTVPKPRMAKAVGPTSATAEAAAPKRAYFLKPLSEMAAPTETVEPLGRPVTMADLPASWRSRVDQPLTAPQGKAGSALSSEALAEVQRRGLSPADALDAITRDATLPANVRLTLRDALLAALGGQP